MPTLNWIGKEAVVNHHLHVPFHLLKDVPDLACGDPGSGQPAANASSNIGSSSASVRPGRHKKQIWPCGRARDSLPENVRSQDTCSELARQREGSVRLLLWPGQPGFATVRRRTAFCLLGWAAGVSKRVSWVNVSTGARPTSARTP